MTSLSGFLLGAVGGIPHADSSMDSERLRLILPASGSDSGMLLIVYEWLKSFAHHSLVAAANGNL